MPHFSMLVVVMLAIGISIVPGNRIVRGECDGLEKTAPGTPRTRKIRVIELAGTPYNRGLTHGKELKAEFHAAVRAWKADLQRQLKKDPDEFIKQFIAKTDFTPAIKKWTPDILEEIRGLANGAGIDQATVFAYQFVDEVWVYAASTSAEHCTGVGFGRKGGQATHIAQNMDLETFRDGTQVVLHIKYPDSDLECLVLSCAGMIGLNGMNNKRIGVCCNTLSQLGHCPDGLPVNCVIRGVLMQKSEKDAVDFLKRVKHAAGQNYILGGPDNVVDLECSAGGASEFKPERGDNVVYHTNHPLASKDFNARYEASLKKKPKDDGPGNSEVRFSAVKKRLEKEADGPRIEFIKKILTSRDDPQHPVCRAAGKDGFYTWSSTIMVLSERPEFHVTIGPPDGAGYEKLSFSKP